MAVEKGREQGFENRVMRQKSYICLALLLVLLNLHVLNIGL